MCKNCKKPYYITTAIAYTSGKPHIGNTYEIVLRALKEDRGMTSAFRPGRTSMGKKLN